MADCFIMKGFKNNKDSSEAGGGYVPGNDAANFILQEVYPSNELIFDNVELPSIMVKIPKQTWAQLGIGTSAETFPAWIVNGREVDYIYFSKFENVVIDEKVYSLPMQDPCVSVTFDQAANYCGGKGKGWHVCTRLEWMAIALWCLKNGMQPLGNNSGNNKIVLTGSGPLTWSHDRTVSGVWDMNGNVWEWNGGIRLVYGELQVISKDGVTFGNDAADSGNSQSATSILWRAINGKNGELIAPDGSGTTANSLKLEWAGSAWKWITGQKVNAGAHGCTFETVTADTDVCETAQHFLQALGLLKSDNTSGIYNGDSAWIITTDAELVFLAGGNWHDNTYAGVFNFSIGNPHSYLDATVGLRSAYVELPTV